MRRWREPYRRRGWTAATYAIRRLDAKRLRKSYKKRLYGVRKTHAIPVRVSEVEFLSIPEKTDRLNRFWRINIRAKSSENGTIDAKSGPYFDFDLFSVSRFLRDVPDVRLQYTIP